MKGLMLAALLLALAGCVTHGQEITPAQIGAITEGETTKPELVASFGEPMTATTQSDGTSVYTWAYSHVGPLGTGRKVKALSVVLDDKGKVESYSVTEM